ncbi:MAG: alpha/beta hydrolase [Gammaproteobacteria bacterium]|nr:alpha/beta hydrolase [Gammaproteobacteria bacterium]
MTEALRLDLGDRDVGALILRAPRHRASLVLGHGAGAGMEHANMAGIAEAFASVGLSTFRFNFPYREDGRNRVDAKDVSTAAIAAALGAAQERLDGPYLLGGHSFGGRMASHAVVDHALDVAGLVFCSFPLHNPRKPSLARAEHMDAIGCPMLFLSGSRDGMASADLMTGLASRLGATLHWLETADHGYKVLKRTRTRTDDVFTEMAGHVDAWLRQKLGV